MLCSYNEPSNWKFPLLNLPALVINETHRLQTYHNMQVKWLWAKWNYFVSQNMRFRLLICSVKSQKLPYLYSGGYLHWQMTYWFQLNSYRIVENYSRY